MECNGNIILSVNVVRSEWHAYVITEKVMSPLLPSYDATHMFVWNWPSNLNDEETAFWAVKNLLLAPSVMG